MHILFNPPIGQTLPISVPFQHLVQLHFTAVLSSCDHTKLKQSRAKVQLWSDILQEGPAADEWGELDFIDDHPDEPVDAGASRIPTMRTTVVDLTNGTGASLDPSILSLYCTVPFSGRLRVSFTYRIVYPSGEIRWLGQFGQNGVLVLGQTDPHLVLHEAWEVGGGASYVCNMRERPVEGLGVARLEDPSDYVVWAIGADSFLREPKDSSLIILVPRIQQIQAVILPPTYVISASLGTTLSLAPSGTITAFGTGSLLLQTYDPRSDLQVFMKRVLAYSGLSISRFFASDIESGSILLAVCAGGCSVKAVIVPFNPGRFGSRLEIPLVALGGLLSPDTTRLSIFSSVTSRMHYFTLSAEESSDEVISFRTGTSGGHFFVSPVYNLSNSKGRQWQVSILSPYSSACANSFPTPPSPRLCPLAHLSPSSRSSSNPSIMLFSDEGICDGHSTEHERPVSELGSALTTRPQKEPPSQVSAFAYMRYVLAVATAIVFEMLYVCFFPLAVLGASGRFEDESENIGNERTPLLREGSDVGGNNGTLEALPPLVTDRVPVVVGSGGDDPDGSLFAEIGGGTAIVAVRADPVVGNLTQQQGLALELNGQDIDVRVKVIDSEVSVLEFDGGKGGWIRISPHPAMID